MKKNLPRLILSLTTYGERLKTVHKTILSLLNQDKKADKILLWLDKEEFELSSVTIELKELISKHFEIKFCANLKSYKKLIPTLIEFPTATIITFDDDIIYPNNLVEDLFNEHLNNPNCIVASRGRIINIKNGDFAPYPSWQFIRNTSKLKAKYCILPIGYGGVLYPPNSLYQDVTDEQKFVDLAPNADDLWFKAMSLMQSTETIILPQECSIKMVLIEGTQETALYATHNAGDANTLQMKAIAQAFKQINKLIKSDEFDTLQIPSAFVTEFMAQQELVQFTKSNVELIRDSAIALKESNIYFSYKLMQLAKLLRPSGPKITKLLEEYGKVLSLRDRK